MYIASAILVRVHEYTAVCVCVLTLVCLFVVEEFSGSSFKFSELFVLLVAVNPVVLPRVCKEARKIQREINKSDKFR